MNAASSKQLPASSLHRIILRFPLTIFFLLTYLFSWWSIPFGGQIPHGPALAALLVLAMSEGRFGLATLWRQFTHWRVGWYWYLAAPGIIVLYHLLALTLNLLQGATALNPLAAQGWQPQVMLLTLLLLGGEWEELGWSGYALPHLQERFAHLAYGPLLAGLIVGGFRAVWHLPLMAYVTDAYCRRLDRCVLPGRLLDRFVTRWRYSAGLLALLPGCVHFRSHLWLYTAPGGIGPPSKRKAAG